jgi:small subunit ribosomal protein S6
MREYELTVVYDLAVAEAGGPDASVAHLTKLVESRGGTVLKVDHWGRRRLAYPIGRALDADYIVSRVNLDPASVSPLEAALGIDERVYRHLIVRADELPVPPPPREPRIQPGAAVQAAEAAPAGSTAEATTEAPAVEAEVPPAAPEVVKSAPAAEAEVSPAATEVAESTPATAAEVPPAAPEVVESGPATEAEVPPAAPEVVESASATAAEPAGEPEALAEAAAGAETSD